MIIKKENEPAYVNSATKTSPLFKDMLRAFWVGGGICAAGQGIREMFLLVADEKSAAVWTSILLIFAGAALTGWGIYDKLGKYAGAGSIIPITGFSNSIVSSAMEFKKEGFILGVGAKMFTVAGPVLVYGITAGVVYGIIYWILGLTF